MTEWKDASSFHAFVAGKQFSTFAAMVKHLLNGPPTLQLFDTNISPKEISLAPVVEIIRVPVSDAESSKVAERSWEGLSRVLAGQPSKNQTMHGKSLNLEQDLFVGIVGWASPEVSPLTESRVKSLLIPARNGLRYSSKKNLRKAWLRWDLENCHTSSSKCPRWICRPCRKHRMGD